MGLFSESTGAFRYMIIKANAKQAVATKLSHKRLIQSANTYCIKTEASRQKVTPIIVHILMELTWTPPLYLRSILVVRQMVRAANAVPVNIPIKKTTKTKI